MVAARIADMVGSWSFVAALVAASAVWIVVNLVLDPLQLHPGLMVGYLGTALTVITALEGPLILLAQRRTAVRDRARDREAFRVAARTEADLHTILVRLDASPADPA